MLRSLRISKFKYCARFLFRKQQNVASWRGFVRPWLIGWWQTAARSRQTKPQEKVHPVSAACPFPLSPCLLPSIKIVHDCYSLRPVRLSIRVPAISVNRFVDPRWIRHRTAIKDLRREAIIHHPNHHHRHTVDILLKDMDQTILRLRDTIPLHRAINSPTILNVCHSL